MRATMSVAPPAEMGTVMKWIGLAGQPGERIRPTATLQKAGGVPLLTKDGQGMKQFHDYNALKRNDAV